jgi:hypothetical protein
MFLFSLSFSSSFSFSSPDAWHSTALVAVVPPFPRGKAAQVRLFSPANIVSMASRRASTNVRKGMIEAEQLKEQIDALRTRILSIRDSL